MLTSALLLGFLGSFHCVGMCGPIAFLLPVNRKNTWKKVIQISLYHLGRLTTYTLIGLLFGLLGKSLSIFGVQQQLSIAIGVIMIIIVVFPRKLSNRFSMVKPIYKVVSRIKGSLGKELKKKNNDTFFTIGFLNGFLPCGLVYMAVFASVATLDIWKGSVYMMLFGLGTVPLMTSAIYLSKIITNGLKRKIRTVIPVFVVLFGCLFILRGMGLGIPYVSPKQQVAKVESKHSCHPTQTNNPQLIKK